MTRGEDGETVAEFTVPVSVAIRAWSIDGETLYDWIGDHDESEEYFDSIAEASTSARDSLGG